MSAFFTGICVIHLLAGLYFILIAILSRNPQNLHSTTGKLTKSDTVRNLHGRLGSIPIWTHYVYTYTVNGREYKHHGQNRRHNKHLLPKIKLVYVKWFPRYAFHNKFDAEAMWFFGISFIIIGLTVLLFIPI